jgi:hypothetical protein
MAYEVYERTGTRVETPTLSITLDRRLVINAAAVRVFVDAGVRSVLLLWDRANHRIALKAAQKGDKNAYAVSIAEGSSSGSLRGKSFLDRIGWKARKREVLPAIWNQRERMLEVTLPLENLASER